MQLPRVVSLRAYHADVDAPYVVPGAPNCTRLATLNASARNCRLKRPSCPKRLSLKMLKSRLFCPWARMLGELRPALPYVYAAGWLNKLVLNHWFRRETAEPLKDGLLLTLV